MITAFIINVFFSFLGVFTSPIRLLSDVTLPADMNAALGHVGATLGLADSFLPIGTLLGVITFYVGTEIIILGYKLVNWLIRKIPTIS
jgi:hypothetical protein